MGIVRIALRMTLCFSVLLIPAALVYMVLTAHLVRSHTDIQLENGCSGVLQTSSTGGNDSNYGSGSGEIPALIGVWTDVCSKEFGHKEAEVVCKQLQCGSEGKRVHPSRFNVTPDDVIPVLITPFSYACSGSEDSLNQCLVTTPTCNLDSADDIVALECGNPTEIEEIDGTLTTEGTSSGKTSSNHGQSISRSMHMYSNTVISILIVLIICL